ncbi:fam-b protein [Plasmodium vinckei lentum]|uniref:Fam-b protein n=1 Tax=Plasmodium vinckei lentum TaxID=138297 RepID=A0A6V7S5F5_PLAVN|nr:fam-b protein [Plasmodium vinckei lentum]
MRVKILKYVFFSIIICSFEYAKNELYFINERNIYLERNIINFRNNRILADADNQFDLYDFYQSTSNLASQFNDCNNDEDIIHLQNAIDSHIKKHKENNTLPNLNNVNGKPKKLILELQKELEEAKRELNNMRNNELLIHPIQDKRVIKMDENMSVPEHEVTTLETECYNFEDEYNEITSGTRYNKIKLDENYKKSFKKFLKSWFVHVASYLVIVSSGSWVAAVILIPSTISLIKNLCENVKIFFKLQKMPK